VVKQILNFCNFTQIIPMKYSIFFVLLLITAVSFGQKRKHATLSYKTIYDTRFSVGDRISMGEIEVVMLPLQKDSIVITDSLELYRSFIQRNTLMTFRLHLIWKNQGVKHPGRTDRTRETLLDYLNDDGLDENDSICYIYGFKHSFVKQGPLLRIELEVIGVESLNMINNPIQGTISLPEMNMLYRNYNNIVEFAVSGMYDSSWVVGNNVELTRWGRGYIARVTGTGREASMCTYSVYGKDTTCHGVFKYRVSNLPDPSIYLGPILMSSLKYCPESSFSPSTSVFAKYPPEITLKASFEVGEVIIKVGDQTIISHGKSLSNEFLLAYENAEEGTEITFVSIGFNGPKKGIVLGPFTRIKQSPKGTKILKVQEQPYCAG